MSRKNPEDEPEALNFEDLWADAQQFSDSQRNKALRALVDCDSTAQMLFILATIHEEDFEDETGFELLRTFAKTFAAHEVE